VAAQKLLSTVVRLGRRGGPAFGAGQPIDILRGKKTPRVLSYGHDSLPVFGIGGELSDGEWRGVVRQLLACGLLAVRGDHGTLALTDLSAEVLRGQRQVLLRRDARRPLAAPVQAAGRGGRGGVRAGAAGADAGVAGAKTPRAAQGRVQVELSPEAEAVFERLRAWRTAVAKDLGMPPYVIFHDSTLREIAASRPSTLAGLAAVSGVGETKLARYGQQILDLLTELA
jgi:ATP-dependent DNA helicase RecQ